MKFTLVKLLAAVTVCGVVCASMHWFGWKGPLIVLGCYANVVLLRGGLAIVNRSR